MKKFREPMEGLNMTNERLESRKEDEWSTSFGPMEDLKIVEFKTVQIFIEYSKYKGTFEKLSQ